MTIINILKDNANVFKTLSGLVSNKVKEHFIIEYSGLPGYTNNVRKAMMRKGNYLEGEFLRIKQWTLKLD